MTKRKGRIATQPITAKEIAAFERSLARREKSRATVKKYAAALRELSAWLGGAALDQERLLAWREHLLSGHKPQTVNGKLSAINAYLRFAGLEGMGVCFLKVQRQAFVDESRELSREEYERLLSAARACGDERLYLLMMTLCATGIRVSELAYITREAVERGQANIRMKGKCRTVLLQKQLCRRLLDYARGRQIASGPIFRTRSGRPMDRSNICHAMKKLCAQAGVDPSKVFPHNLRHLFARIFFSIEKNLAHLADVLGHSRIETTRIYVATSASAHARILDQMRLIL
ncbi:MAG: tyrosine-type recombinase/integrase [Oscillospiraceae bacterium]|nr:tyrosine-type recombinase/integrase [Oscillospiraceae bacterium]